VSGETGELVPAPLTFDAVQPSSSFLAVLEARGLAPRWDVGTDPKILELAEATTVLSLRYGDGVVMAGDRRATAGNVIAHKRVRKVYQADRFSAVAISGTAGMAVEMIRVFQTELEHYEKIEDVRLSLDGKANFLARMVRNNLSLAFQGLVVIPLFCGYDEEDREGRLYTFDVVGGRYEEQDYATTGSGGAEARSFLKAKWHPDLDEQQALGLAIESLIAAAEEDAATGGVDLKRGIFPTVVTVSAAGYREVPDERVAELATPLLEARP